MPALAGEVQVSPDPGGQWLANEMSGLNVNKRRIILVRNFTRNGLVGVRVPDKSICSH
jgi:hypothetical protein